MDRVATDLGIEIRQIIDFELSAYDTNEPTITGMHGEYISSHRIDNLASSYCAVDSISNYLKDGSNTGNDVSMVVLFDHEEVGS